MRGEALYAPCLDYARSCLTQELAGARHGDAPGARRDAPRLSGATEEIKNYTYSAGTWQTAQEGSAGAGAVPATSAWDVLTSSAVRSDGAFAVCGSEAENRDVALRRGRGTESPVPVTSVLLHHLGSRTAITFRHISESAASCTRPPHTDRWPRFGPGCAADALCCAGRLIVSVPCTVENERLW